MPIWRKNDQRYHAGKNEPKKYNLDDICNTTEEINDIYEVVFNLVKEDNKITINKFRIWIIENYKNIQSHYDNLLSRRWQVFL